MSAFPLILRDPTGQVEDVGLANEKSVAKSVEQGELWCVDGTTGRVLPYRGGGVRFVAHRLNEREGRTWAEFVLSERSGPEQRNTNDSTSAEPTVGQADEKADRASTSLELRGRVLDHLWNVVRERHVQMPEGSYTTHLFSKGADKIRKKTGEEAVELILARTDREIISEAADLLYHALVMLEALGLSLDDVLTELESRFD